MFLDIPPTMSTLPVQLSLFYFGADSDDPKNYRWLLDAGRYADANGFTAAWVPERHFARFGGLYGNPSVTGAALAVATTRLSIRAGSVVFPLNHPLRIAEDWAIIDNLSNGRVGVAVATGWHANDFVLAPASYSNRRDIALERIEIVRRLWRGEAIEFPNGEGRMVPIAVLPRPIQPELPVWMTTGNASEEGFRKAGELGFNVLTANFAHYYQAEHLRTCVVAYRDAIMRKHGRRGHVTLMVHAYAGENEAEVRETATPAMRQYLEINMQMQMVRGSERGAKFQELSEHKKELMLTATAKANMGSPLSFIGTKDELLKKGQLFEEWGVDELACLSDFGIPFERTMASLALLADLLR